MKNNGYSTNLKITALILLFIIVYPACFIKHKPFFVAVRESDFRFGPVCLPLNENAKKELILFLAKEGDNSISDIVDPYAQERYAGLLVLLSDSEFLEDSRNFKLKRQEKTVKISKRLEQWLRNPIVYQIVDANQERPPLINPISISDGIYWWVFYRAEDGDGGFRIVKLLVTLDVMREIRH